MRIRLFGAALVLGLSTACGGDGPSGPSGPNGGTLLNGTFTMRVDGQPFAAVGATVLTSGNIISIGAGNAANQGFGMAWIHDGLRTYTIGTDVGVNATLNHAAAGGWMAGVGIGSGTITVTTRTANRVAGTFALILGPVQNTAATGNKTITQGAFDLTF